MRRLPPDLHLSDRRVRFGSAVALFALVTAATYAVAYPKIFFGFAPWDDEGYLLISLESFLDRGSLYDEVYSQYGPFYYEFWGGLFWFLDAPVTHDNGRFATLLAWILASLTVGLSICRITGSIVLGAVVQMLVFAGLNTLAYEPMHPGGLTCLLVAFIVAVSTFVGAGLALRAMALLGIAVAALLLVKVNVGGFALAAVLLVCSVNYAPIAERRWVRGAIEAGFVLTPIVLMAGKLDQSWVQNYCVHVTIAALAVVLVLEARAAERVREPRELRSFVVGFVGAALVICAIAVATGTGVGSLFEGVLSRPLEATDGFNAPLDLPEAALALDLIALIAAAACAQLVRFERPEAETTWPVLISIASIVIGIEMGLSAVGRSLLFDQSGSNFEASQLSLLAFAWLALVPIPGAARSGGADFALRLLPPLAVLQALHAYPVAGSQLAWSAYLLVPVGAVCVGNGVRGLTRPFADRRWRLSVAVVGAVAGLALGLHIADETLRRPWKASDANYDASTPLGLPGSARIRFAAGDAALYREVSTALAQRCGTFVSLPGLNSFHLWADRPPPTGLNAGYWMDLLSDGEQRRIVAATNSHQDVCLLRNTPLVEGWLGGAPLPGGPLVTFMRNGFEPVATFGSYELLRRRD